MVKVQRLFAKTNLKIQVCLIHAQFNNKFTQHFSQKVKVLFFYRKRRNEMSYKLVIAEKPSVAQSITKVIGADKREDGYLEGKKKKSE